MWAPDAAIAAVFLWLSNLNQIACSTKRTLFQLFFSLKNSLQASEICKEVEEEGLDPEDVLCTIREDYTRAPPLAQEDDFDDV